MLKLSLPQSRSRALEVLTPSPELLKQLLTEYEGELDSTEPSLSDCFFTFIPTRLIQRILIGDTGRIPAAGYLWLMHQSGYYAGVWLRQNLRALQLETMAALPGAPISRELFESTIGQARAGAAAAVRGDDAALAYLEERVRELVATFGYIRGSTLHGMTVPTWRGPPVANLIVPGGLLWCGYRNPRLELMSHLYDVSVRLESSSDPRWRELAAWIGPLQEAETERGLNVWRAQAPSLARLAPFAELIETSAAYLEYMQAAALLSVRALAERDGATARQAAIVSAIALLGHQSYGLGLMDSTNDDDPENSLPVLRT
jgi:hypothetical protein